MNFDERPHWQVNFDDSLWPIYEDFRIFLALLWDHLKLPEPTKAQMEIAHRLQHGYDSYEAQTRSEEDLEGIRNSPRQDIIRCFRGLGKSYVTAGYAVWRLARNPRDEKVLILSASGSKAKAFVSQVKGILESWDLVSWLLEGTRAEGAPRRDQSDNFDVQFSSLSQSPSLVARGITGQITGSRATLLIPDDMEVPENSKTEEARQAILNKVRSDFLPITKTEHGQGDIICLGTPQTEESVYNALVTELLFRCFTIPARFPKADKLGNYELQRRESSDKVDILAPYLRGKFERGGIAYGDPTDSRFPEDELIRLEAQGRASFALQYQLDTSLSDSERYPLRQHDLIVMSLNHLKAPMTLNWGKNSDRSNVLQYPNLGFSGDHFLGPLFVDSEWTAYDYKLMYVDPAGRGKDETAWAIVASLGGYIFVLKVGGIKADPNRAMVEIANQAKLYGVEKIEVEPNFAPGVWITAFNPVMNKIWPSGTRAVESDWAKGQKEVRIIDTLEPAVTAHRVIIDEEVISTESAVRGEDLGYSLLYQWTHITRERGCLKHDDRLDSVAGGVAALQRSLGVDAEVHREALLRAQRDAAMERFIRVHEEGGVLAGRGRWNPDEGEFDEVVRTRVG